LRLSLRYSQPCFSRQSWDWEASGALNQEDVMMENGRPRKRRQLSPEEKWEVFLEVASQQLSQADAAESGVWTCRR
jgi:hypothetical protein